ncbi:APH-domain-containing protein [Gigaspora margarita]|uniref:APH-domain-containing protein n=1 Tax=Gigaspora margarita TaxID=4874 RepID=A0A8H3WWF7_GIGMA|nr:APH-domain-containing protein [Gigaspora margarita]
MSSSNNDNDNDNDNNPGTSVVRLQINVSKLEQYLVSRIPGFKTPLEVKQFKYGQSNPTYHLIDANKKNYVLRKKPPGKLLDKTAHAVEREFKVLDALSRNTDVPVPKVYILCEDNEILGTPFFVMEYLKGRIFEEVLFSPLPVEERRKCWYSAIESLAKLHSVNYKSIGLENYGKPSGFYSRQIRSLPKISEKQAATMDDEGNKVGPLPRLNEMIQWFKNNEIADDTSIIHGDFKIDNLVFHPTEPRVIGILDWELSTIGHPLSDLANLLMNFFVKDIPYSPIPGLRDVKNLSIPSANELIQVYCEKSGRQYPIPNFEFAIAFTFFRTAVILQGIAARIARKQASSDKAKEYAKFFKDINLMGFEIIDRTIKSKL